MCQGKVPQLIAGNVPTQALFFGHHEAENIKKKGLAKGKIAAVTMVRGDTFFIARWIAYYGAQLGYDNVYVIFDGEDQQLPPDIAPSYHFVFLPHITMPRAAGDKYRIATINKVKDELFGVGYEGVIGADADEFLLCDPHTSDSLLLFLLGLKNRGFSSVSALGLDLAENCRVEAPLDPSVSILAQRRYAVLSSRYTKASVIFSPSLRWGSGFHRIKGHRYYIASSLYLLHTGYCSSAIVTARLQDETRLKGGWDQHLNRRCKSIRHSSTKRPRIGDRWLKRARTLQQIVHPIHSWNKPKMPTTPIVVQLPERFKTIQI